MVLIESMIKQETVRKCIERTTLDLKQNVSTHWAYKTSGESLKGASVVGSLRHPDRVSQCACARCQQLDAAGLKHVGR